MACYLASVAPHSGDWLLGLPIANCGLQLEDEAVRVAVGMRLGLTLCVPHKCHCGSDVDAHGRHAMVCKKAPGRVARHQVLNDIIFHQRRRRTGSQGAIWSEQAGWKTARWIVSNSMAERQTPFVGCHGGQHVSQVLCGHSRDWSRTCS